MRLFVLAFLLGICSIVFLDVTTVNTFLITAVCILMIGSGLYFRFSRLFFLSVTVFMGFLWVNFFSILIFHNQVPKILEGKTLWVQGDIISIPNKKSHYTQFIFKLIKLVSVNDKNIRPEERSKLHNLKVKLNWFHCQTQLKAGDRWQLQIRLKRPHGFRNAFGFDMEKWLFRQHIRATGYVVNSLTHNYWLKSASTAYAILRLRQTIEEKLMSSFQQQRFYGLLPALVIGDRQHISKETWQILRRTGTTHLIAISGLHIGLMAGLFFFVVNLIWRQFGRWALIISAQQIAALAGVLSAWCYSLLAGFSLPTQRAAIMLSVVWGAMVFKRNISLFSGIATSIFIILLLNPLSVLGVDFWLSFGCVSLIVYVTQHRFYTHKSRWQWGRVQYAMTLGLFPILIFYFHEMVLMAPIANAMAIPWVGFLILPMVIFGSIFQMFNLILGKWILWLALKNLQGLGWVLTQFAYLPFSHWHFGLTVIGLLWMLSATLLFLAPTGFPARYLAWFFFLPIMTGLSDVPKSGEIGLTVFDVGEGLAILVRTQRHILIFDTGAQLSESFDMGTVVLLPYLRGKGIRQIDRLVLSHGDNDHIGGLKALFMNIQVDRVLTSAVKAVKKRMIKSKESQFSAKNSPPIEICRRGQHWDWDGVHFKILWPLAGEIYRGNNSSCVLKISVEIYINPL
jgi:competence protein ComEC